MAKFEGMSHHISSLSELRRTLDGRIELDDQIESDAVMLEQHLVRVRAVTAEVVQKGHKSEGYNAVERITLTVRGGTPLPSAQHGAAAGCAGRTHDDQHEIRFACGLDNIRRSRRVCGSRTAEGGEDAGRAGQMHGYDLDHIGLNVCDRRTVKHGFHDTSPAFSKLHSGLQGLWDLGARKAEWFRLA